MSILSDSIRSRRCRFPSRQVRIPTAPDKYKVVILAFGFL
jgi:hypothetical protein